MWICEGLRMDNNQMLKTNPILRRLSLMSGYNVLLLRFRKWRTKIINVLHKDMRQVIGGSGCLGTKICPTTTGTTFFSKFDSISFAWFGKRKHGRSDFHDFSLRVQWCEECMPQCKKKNTERIIGIDGSWYITLGFTRTVAYWYILSVV